jgi:REP element-mobilizing transposase RayT
MNHDRALLKQSPVSLDSNQRAAVESGVRETCAIRQWSLWGLNVRTNHVHAVVSANNKPDTVFAALKANATRSMREAGCWTSGLSPWAYRGSGKYLWSEKDLADAIAYVEYDQGEPPK